MNLKIAFMATKLQLFSGKNSKNNLLANLTFIFPEDEIFF